ncbi:cyclin-A1-4-like isoform X2 [Durio zibethinus]|uniref:Cyclin-A1-4-like isoform X2 n=1 Tax=Durio zibethinus TaxID=66656 RepID=A0A6P6B609_DURZI|nr:cyclin-A1-4-like isoform X2 [Durio zibethinus]
MSTRNRRLNTSSSSSSSSRARRPSITRDQSKKMGAAKTQFSKKRVALSDITNQGNGFQNGSRVMATHSKPMVPCTSKVAKKKETSTCTQDNDLCWNTLPRPLSLESCGSVSCMDTIRMRDDHPTTEVLGLPSSSSLHTPRSMNISPCRSFCASVSLDETMSTSDSLSSPDFEYVENEELSAVKPIERKANNNLSISEYTQKEGKISKRNVFLEVGPNDNVVAVDNTFTDPQFCPSIVHDIYKNARAAEAKKRPSVHFMEMVQKDINASMRAILIDWLVEVTEEYRLVPETLFLTVNYIDRYLSGNSINRQQLQLLGVACMMIASKYEEICAPQVEEFCYVTDNTYCKDEILEMESAVLNYLKFEMTVPTARFFLRQFVHAAQMINQVQSMQFECLASYIAELSLLEYTMLHYAPSQIAASAAFLAKFILSPSKKPWDSILGHYTLYRPSDLGDCVKALHHLCRNGGCANLPAIREKYSQHKYKFVAKKYCPASIPQEFFQDLSK